MSSRSTIHSRDRHPSVLALLNSSAGETDPKKIIRTLARSKVEFAKRHRWNGPKFCPRILCSIFGIRCYEVSHDIRGDGRILMESDGRPRIEFASGRTEERQRFTIFHEFAHTLFPDYCEYLPLYTNPATELSPAEKEFENLCDVAAAEMLLPAEDFIGDLKQTERIGFNEIERLRQRYGSSPDATCLRLSELCNSTAFSVVFLTDQKMNFTGSGPLWVKYSCKSKSFNGYIRNGISPPENSVTIDCLNGAEASAGPAEETWSLNGNSCSYFVESFKLPVVGNPHYPKVATLLLPAGYKGGAAYV